VVGSDIVQIITDSTCALPPETTPQVREHIRVLRTSVQFGTESFVEGALSLEQFYIRIEQGGPFPHTSQPSPEEYYHTYREAAPHGPILAILISAGLSSTYSSALAMAREVPEADVVAFDSQFFSSALGHMVAEATEMALAGSNREQILERLAWRRARTALFIAIDQLSFLQRSGRLNFLQAGLATMFDLKPVLAVRSGKLEAIARVRSRRRSLERLLALAKEHALTLDGPVWVSAMHGRAPDTAAWLLAEMQAQFPVERAFVNEAPASVALHGGPGVVGVMVTAATS
nr:DegV family protein [Ardenticatenales bacterium]